MKFSSKEDIDTHIDQVFAMLTEFETYERSAMRRGIEVQRVNPSAPVGIRLAWDVRFRMRGKDRKARLDLVECDPLAGLCIVSRTEGIDATMQIDLLALSRRRTRMAVALNLAPRTLPARVFVQSLKLAKGNLNKRFKRKVSEYAKNMEDRSARMA